MSDLQNNSKTFEDDGTTEEEAKAEYHKIAERPAVRSGPRPRRRSAKRAKSRSPDDEVTQGLVERVRQFPRPGKKQGLGNSIRRTLRLLAEIRAPIFEEKVVDHILNEVTVEEEEG